VETLRCATAIVDWPGGPLRIDDEPQDFTDPCTIRFRVEVEGLDGATVASQPDFEVGPAEARWLPVSVQIPRDVARLLGSGVHPVRFEVESVDASGDKSEVEEKSTFVVPR
jgi:hypothetical protein